MCSQIAKRRINNVNRCTIVLLAMFDFTLDGYQIADIFFFFFDAVVVMATRIG